MLAPTPEPQRLQVIELRKKRWKLSDIAKATGVHPSTASRILARAGLGRPRCCRYCGKPKDAPAAAGAA